MNICIQLNSVELECNCTAIIVKHTISAFIVYKFANRSSHWIALCTLKQKVCSGILCNSLPTVVGGVQKTIVDDSTVPVLVYYVDQTGNRAASSPAAARDQFSKPPATTTTASAASSDHNFCSCCARERIGLLWTRRPLYFVGGSGLADRQCQVNIISTRDHLQESGKGINTVKMFPIADRIKLWKDKVSYWRDLPVPSSVFCQWLRGGHFRVTISVTGLIVKCSSSSFLRFLVWYRVVIRIVGIELLLLLVMRWSGTLIRRQRFGRVL